MAAKKKLNGESQESDPSSRQCEQDTLLLSVFEEQNFTGKPIKFYCLTSKNKLEIILIKTLTIAKNQNSTKRMWWHELLKDWNMIASTYDERSIHFAAMMRNPSSKSRQWNVHFRCMERRQRQIVAHWHHSWFIKDIECDSLHSYCLPVSALWAHSRLALLSFTRY